MIYHRQIPNVVYYQKYPHYYYHTPKYYPKPQPKRYNRPSVRHNVERPKRKYRTFFSSLFFYNINIFHLCFIIFCNIYAI